MRTFFIQVNSKLCGTAKKPFKIIGVNDWLTGLSLNPALSCHPERNDKPKSITSSAQGVAAGDGDESTYGPLDLLHKCSI